MTLISYIENKSELTKLRLRKKLTKFRLNEFLKFSGLSSQVKGILSRTEHQKEG